MVWEACIWYQYMDMQCIHNMHVDITGFYITFTTNWSFYICTIRANLSAFCYVMFFKSSQIFGNSFFHTFLLPCHIFQTVLSLDLYFNAKQSWC